MKKLFILILIAAAAWYGWKNYPTLMSKVPMNEAVVENETGHGIERLRFTADGQTQVRESLAAGDKATFAFKVASDSPLKLTWQWADAPGERTWTGGNATAGPVVARHIMTIDGDAEVNYRAEMK